jgi:ABC-type polar amino acid transport system ATPase subunit
LRGIECRSLTKRYGSVLALEDVSVSAAPGSVVCVLGPSGGGKSTLVRQMHLLEAPDHGEILVDGRPTPKNGKARLEMIRRFGLVQQRPGLLRGTSMENVAFPLRARGAPPAKARAEAASWLARLGLAGRADALPHELSGGEAQRVALARALVTRPDFLLVDEGTNQLDPHAVRLAESVIREQAARGCTVLLVTHNVPQTLRMADSFVFLEEGRVVESGPRAQLAVPETEELRLFLETGS